MAGRRPGPAPAEVKRRTNVDPVIGKDGWTEVAPEPCAGEVPAIPAWVNCTDEARAVYEDLARLPQAATWGVGTWLQLHMSLPLIGRYLQRPGSENFKAIVSTLGAGLSMTELDMQRARIKVKRPDPVAEQAAAASVSSLQERRKRLTDAS
jgi:hypothetical protein